MVDVDRVLDVEIIPTPPTVATRATARAEARARAGEIAQSRGTARLLAEVDRLIQAKASKAVIRQELDPALREAEQLYAGADAKVADSLRAALDTGDTTKLRAAVTRQTKAAKVTPIGKAGAKTTFDPATMEGVGGVEIPDGAQVIIVRRGSTIEGLTDPLARAQVQLVPTKAVKVVPRKVAAQPAKPTPVVKPSKVKAPAGPESVRRPGTDVLHEVTPQSDWLRRADKAQETAEYQDHVLTALVKRQEGWTEPARVVTPAALDRAIGSGWIEMWRGVREDGGASARRIAEATRTGEWEQGRGIYGSGVYTSVRRTTAEEYRDSELAATNFWRVGERDREVWGPAPNYEYLPGFDVQDQGMGGLIRMALDPDAKIVDYEELRQEHLAYLRSQDFLRMAEGPYKRAMTDSSFYGAARGYDGIKIEGPSHNDGARYPDGIANRDEPPQYIIFNRSVVIMERASRRYDT